jgi:dTDP-4-amino-4,6-dideoxygalactose transaminase
MRALERHAIEARPVWKPMHLQPLFAGAPYFSHTTGHTAGQDVSAGLYMAGMCLPSGSNMAPEAQDRVIDHLRRAVLQWGAGA